MNITTTEVKKYRTANNEIWLDEFGMLWLQPDPDSELVLEEAKACFEIYKELGIHRDRKVFQIIDARHNVSMSKEAREYAIKMGPDYFIASAVISNKLSVRLIVNFFLKFHKAVVPLKLFEHESDARKWLNRFQP